MKCDRCGSDNVKDQGIGIPCFQKETPKRVTHSYKCQEPECNLGFCEEIGTTDDLSSKYHLEKGYSMFYIEKPEQTLKDTGDK